MNWSTVEIIRVAANGINFEVATLGSGDRLALCLHGFPEHAYSWRYQMPLLAQLGYRVWAPNLRGYGNTDSPREVSAYKTRTLVQDVASLIQAANPRETLLLAHDWGAALAWSLAISPQTRESGAIGTRHGAAQAHRQTGDYEHSASGMLCPRAAAPRSSFSSRGTCFSFNFPGFRNCCLAAATAARPLTDPQQLKQSRSLSRRRSGSLPRQRCPPRRAHGHDQLVSRHLRRSDLRRFFGDDVP